MSTLDDVLARLSEIIAWAKAANSPLGYFPALYFAMTAEVKRGIANGQFDDAARMERLDVVFAQRYFAAFEAWQAGGNVPRSWAAAFQAGQNDGCIVLQHLLLGINAHINFDLGAAAAEIAPGDSIFSLERDFARINDTIGSLTERVQDRLAALWPPLGIFDYLLKDRDEWLSNFSISAARRASWEVAKHLAFLGGEPRQFYLSQLDGGIALLAGRIMRPGFFISSALPLVRRCERGTVAEKIGVLEHLA